VKMEAHARLLGVPQLQFAHASFEPPLNKATALLYYLAYKGEWCSRDELLYLFYPDVPESTGRTNLRQRLSTLRRLPYSEGLIVETGRLRWPIDTDVQAFKRQSMSASAC
jgi:DNA-binding SARP family transcriptional activator